MPLCRFVNPWPGILSLITLAMRLLVGLLAAPLTLLLLGSFHHPPSRSPRWEEHSLKKGTNSVTKCVRKQPLHELHPVLMSLLAFQNASASRMGTSSSMSQLPTELLSLCYTTLFIFCKMSRRGHCRLCSAQFISTSYIAVDSIKVLTIQKLDKNIKNS